MTHPATRPYIWMLCGSFSFTVMAELVYVLTHHRECDWQTVAVFRAGLVALFAAAMAWFAGAKLVFLRPWRLWVRSVAGSCSMVCTFYAFGRLPAADVITLTNTFPIWVALISWPLYGKAPGVKMWIAILVGVVGVVLVEQPHLESGNLGVFTALAAALLTAVAMLGLHSLSDLDPRAIVVHFSTVATVTGLGAWVVGYTRGWLTRDLGHTAEPQVVGMLLLMGLTATVGQLFLTLAFGSGSPTKVSIVGLTQIVFALVFDAWLWGRPVNAVTILGTLLVIAPTAWLLSQPVPGSHEPTGEATPNAPLADARGPAAPSRDISEPIETPGLRP
jgi:drug/metabolite transporter (DMT)-like permease